MTAKETFEYLIKDAGFDEATAATILKAAENQKVQERALALKAQSEFDAITAQKAQLEASYTKAKTYEDWYQKNAENITKLQTREARYRERFGDLDENAPPQAAPTKQFSQEDIDKMVDARTNAVIQQSYGPKWSELLIGSGTILEKHLRSKRDKPIDWAKLSEMATKKNGDLISAYDEYDAPERQAADTKARESEIERRVKEELQKRGTPNYFPAGADPSAVSPLARRSKPGEVDHNSLVQTFLTGKYDPTSTSDSDSRSSGDRSGGFFTN